MRGKKRTINLDHDDDSRAAVERIRRECRLNGYKVVDCDLGEYADRRYVVIQRAVKPKIAPKKRFFA